MSRKATEVNEKSLNKLKELVLENIDFKLLRSVDCDKLARVISEKTKTLINGISFKRLYGFTKYPFNPSVQTLDILSQFIGYRSWYEFEMSLTDNQPISNRELDILVSFYDFDLINNIEFHDGGIQSMSRKIALRFREDVATFKRATSMLAQKKYAQIFFIEHFPDYDNLCTYYYLLYEDYLKYNAEKTAQLFSHSMLFLKSFYTLNEEDCNYHISKMRSFSIDKDVYPYLIGRYFAYNMLFEFKYGQKDKVFKYYDKYLKIRSLLPKKGKRFLDFPASEYIVAEGLLHIGAYTQCLEVIELAFQEFPLKMEFARKGYYRQMQLLGLIAKKRLVPSFNIDKPLQKINPDNFYFISQKYFSSIYYYAIYLSRNSIDDLQKAKSLASEMGNKYLEKVFILTEKQEGNLLLFAIKTK